MLKNRRWEEKGYKGEYSKGFEETKVKHIHRGWIETPL
jgi:hypothetical protein